MQNSVLSSHASAETFRVVQPLVLASASPRRIDFLRQLGISFRVLIPSKDAEPLPLKGEKPADFSARAAKAKAESVYTALADQGELLEHMSVLGADTVVFLEDTILGKPRDFAEAAAYLSLLSGKKHTVVTSCYLMFGMGKTSAFSGAADVFFGSWSDDVLLRYAQSGEGLDKAGGYALQGRGSFLVEKIHGSWSAVIGLPVAETVAALIQAGIIVQGQ